MTIKELIEELKKYPEDTTIDIYDPYKGYNVPIKEVEEISEREEHILWYIQLVME